MTGLKLPVGIRNNRLVWNSESKLANSFTTEQCEEQHSIWVTRQRRMEEKNMLEMSMSCPNGNWDILIALDEVGEIAYKWYLLAGN